jgi:hypothetical protein
MKLTSFEASHVAWASRPWAALRAASIGGRLDKLYMPSPSKGRRCYDTGKMPVPLTAAAKSAAEPKRRIHFFRALLRAQASQPDGDIGLHLAGR